MDRRKRIILCSCLAIALVFTLSVCLSAMQIVSTASNYTTVVIDAGHGGIDGGVCGVNSKVKESEINLQISWQLQKLIKNAGLNAVMTRKTEAGLYGFASSGFKKRDMLQRKQIIESNKPVAVISIHQNKFSSKSRRGGQVFYKIKSEQSLTLANSIQNELNSLYADITDYSALQGDYYILNCSEYASVIVECGFLSNPTDDKLLNTSAFQEQMAETIFKGLINYLSQSTLSIKYKE